jgi:hypothetical protein
VQMGQVWKRIRLGWEQVMSLVLVPFMVALTLVCVTHTWLFPNMHTWFLPAAAADATTCAAAEVNDTAEVTFPAAACNGGAVTGGGGLLEFLMSTLTVLAFETSYALVR